METQECMKMQGQGKCERDGKHKHGGKHGYESKSMGKREGKRGAGVDVNELV